MKLNITKGEWQRMIRGQMNIVANDRLIANTGGHRTNSDNGEHIRENNDNGELIIDAGNTYQKCGKLPSELLSELSNVAGLLIEARGCIGSLKRSMLVHPDCTEGSEFDDYTSYAQEVEDKIESLIEKL